MEEEKQKNIESNRPEGVLVVSPERMMRVSSPSRDEDSSKSSSSSAIPLVPLQVPKAFNYPERYNSPTDAMVSPITQGILARKRRPIAAGGEALPLPPINPTTLFQGVDSTPFINLESS